MFRWCRAEGIGARSQYLWGTLVAARNAAVLGIPHVSALELGVAGGNGLLELEIAAAAAGELTVAVNLSGRQIRDAALVDDVAAVLAATELDGGSLTLEVTETTLLGDTAVTVGGDR